jgi:triacylglycerol esterase/lipase EstA (alpha/beta hydrolase family)
VRVGFVWLCLALLAPLPAAANGDTVVLLHGLYRSERSMRPLEAPVSKAGFRVVNLDYDSRSQSPETFVAALDAQLADCCSDAPKLHFVTHSLGGIVTRAYLATRRPANLGRVVMLAPPNHGSPLGDVVAGSAVLRFLLGSTAARLGTDPDSFPNALPRADFELGVIAGTASRNPFGALLIDGESDGTVSVSSTRLEGMTDFITVDEAHTFIMRSDEVAAQTVRFLTSGRFAHAAP